MSYQATDWSHDERIGTRIGGYLVESLLGVGGMGRVYSATAADGTRVALKMVKQQFALDEQFRRRFAREARVARSVSNPHVVAVLDTGEHDGVPYLAEQFIEGVTLESKLKQDGCLDVPSVVRICAGVAEGLRALWDAGMVHRDIKPGNILLDRAGRSIIADFGLAKDTQGSVLTQPGQAIGSLDYMAPEQIRGEEVTAAADVYSLGCVMFECVQGRPPFADRQGFRALWAHLQEPPPDVGAGRADAPPAFTSALMAALRKNPAERPASSTIYAASLSDAAGIQLACAVC